MEASTQLATGQRPTAAEAKKLWRLWKSDGDATARDHLILSYAPMVRYLASRKVRELPVHCELEDLVSCGLLALVNSVDRFDPEKGATFEQYAWTRVSGAIVDELRRQDFASRSARRTGRAIDSAREKWIAEKGSAPTEAELAKVLEMDTAELRTNRDELERASLVSLNTRTRGTTGDLPVEIGETIEAPIDESNPEAATLSGERGEILREAIAELSEREQKVLVLFHVHKLPGADIGSELGVSESRVSQILSGIRIKLREHLSDYDRAGFDKAAV
ncbi:MAG: sigma-70 family RNA polymerase sigma factor [Gaiellaceae bacterium]